MKIGILVDSVACITNEKLKKYDMELVKLYVNSGDKSYVEHDDIDVEMFFKLKDEGNKMTSSQPSPEDFLNGYENMKARGYTDVISIHPTNVMSGTVNSARLGADMVEGINVHIFEGNCAGFEQEMFVDQTLAKIEDGLEPEAIISQLKQLKEVSDNYLYVADLLVLAESGRISKTIAKIGNLVKLKPLISLKPDGFELSHKYRTMKKVLNQIVSDVEAYTNVHGKTNVYLSPIDITEFQDELAEAFSKNPNVNFVVCGPLGPVLHVNFGRRGFGISWTKA